MKSISTKLLTVEIKPGADEIEIHCNQEGLDDLIRFLTQLRQSKELPNHTHLATPEWAGDELTQQKQGEENTLAHQVSIHLCA